MDQAHGGLRVALPLGVFLCHVLEPGQPQIRRGLVTLGNSEDGFRKFQRQLVSDTVFLLGMDTYFFHPYNLYSTSESCSPVLFISAH